tara:strand:+ start:23 stop:568 length:546 start_codon:yes stop_codon:yes gene_type:complete
MNAWSPDLECVLEGIRQNSVIMSNEHKKTYLYLKGRLRYFKVPIIVLSAINSITAIGLQPYMEQGSISMLNCLLALSCGIIGSIELYLGISVAMERELLSSKSFYLLAIEIYKVLALQADHRVVNGNEFLNEKYGEYIQLVEDSNLLAKKISDRLSPLPTGDICSLASSSSQVSLKGEEKV